MQFRGAQGSHVVMTVWMAVGAALACLPIGMLIGALGVSWLVGGMTVLPIVAAGLTVYPRRFISGICVRMEPAVIYVQSGVWWQRQLAIPIGSLRTVEVTETPLQRRYHCAHIWLRFTGGTAVLPFLHIDDVARFRRALKDR